MSSPVSRRGVLAAVPPILALSGCSNNSSSESTPAVDAGEPDSSTPSDTPTSTSTPGLRGDRPQMEQADEIPDHPDGPVTDVSVGSDATETEKSHPASPTVEIWNMGPQREVSVLVRGAETGAHVDRATTFARGESLAISFDGEDRYLVAVGVVGDTEYATVIGRDRFFCNDSRTFAYVQPDGVIESITSTTALECPTETADG